MLEHYPDPGDRAVVIFLGKQAMFPEEGQLRLCSFAPDVLGGGFGVERADREARRSIESRPARPDQPAPDNADHPGLRIHVSSRCL
jgi:hypothetical protein